MTNWLNSLQRWALTSRLKLVENWTLRNARHSPETFRRAVRLLPDSPEPFHNCIQPWQAADFRALDPAWKKLAGLPITPRYRRAWIERPRGHAKTSDTALQIAWILLFAHRPLAGIAAAADREQASLLTSALARIARLNPTLCGNLVFRKNSVTNPHTHATLEVISSDVQSSWGALPDFVICDELCHWEKPEMWHSLLSSAAKNPHCLLIVLTNAGVGRGWQWEAREAARQSPAWYFSSLDDARAPWITAETIEEQKQLLPRPVFDRLWRNIWQQSDGQFVTREEARACCDPSLSFQTHGQPGLHYIAAIDYAEKHDYTVATLIHRDPRATDRPHLIVDRMDVVVPTPHNPVKVAWVEDWIRHIAANFHNVTFIVDEYQLLGTIQKLEATHDIRRFEFRSGKGNHALALNLRQLITHQQISWPENTGATTLPSNEPPQPGATAGSPSSAAPHQPPLSAFGFPLSNPTPAPTQPHRAPNQPSSASDPTTLTPGPRPLAPDSTLESELASLLLKQSTTGLVRIDHHRDNIHHDDRAFALGAAALHAIQHSPTPDYLQITPPTQHGTFNW